MTDEEQDGLAAKLREVTDLVEQHKPLLQEVTVNVVYAEDDPTKKGEPVSVDVRIEWPDPRDTL